MRNRILMLLKPLILITIILTYAGCGNNPFGFKVGGNFTSFLLSFLQGMEPPSGSQNTAEGAQSAGKTLADGLIDSICTHQDHISETVSFAVDTIENGKKKLGTAMIIFGEDSCSFQDDVLSFDGTEEVVESTDPQLGEKVQLYLKIYVNPLDRRLEMRARVLHAAYNSDKNNTGDSMWVSLDKIYWDASKQDNLQKGNGGVYNANSNVLFNFDTVTIYHNNTIGLKQHDWDDNSAELKLTVQDPNDNNKPYYVVLEFPRKDNLENIKEKGWVYTNPDYKTGLLLTFIKYRDGRVEYKIYDENGNVIDSNTHS